MAKLCSNCKTGEFTYMQDNTEALCPYMFCYKNGKCAYFEPIKAEDGKETLKAGGLKQNTLDKKGNS